MNVLGILNATSFVEERSWAFLDNALFWVVSAAVALVIGRLGGRPFFPLVSLRTRVTVILFLVTELALASLAWGLNAFVAISLWAIVLLVGIQSILANLSRVGIMNAFSSTTSGLTPEGSLKLVETNLDFLGIGGGKLTVSDQFMKALSRCAAAGGRVRFLLSDPDNPSLERLAKQNQRDDASYRSRVRESVREILNKAQIANVQCEVRIYKLETELELPHFRLMFINDALCLFSHLVWNSAEGWDNPQLILRRNTKKKPNSLYLGYKTYFDDLWNSGSVRTVTSALVAKWPS